MARVLLVDDDPGVRSLLVRLLRAQGHETAEAESGVKALEFLEESNADLVVSDLRMPGMSGLALLELVKKRVPHVPIVLLTAYASPETTVDAVQLGAFDYLEKPFRNDVLLSVVERALTAGKGRTRATDGYAGSNPVIKAFLAGGLKGPAV
jgi:DNA-binding NtrC family response regulator